MSDSCRRAHPKGQRTRSGRVFRLGEGTGRRHPRRRASTAASVGHVTGGRVGLRDRRGRAEKGRRERRRAGEGPVAGGGDDGPRSRCVPVRGRGGVTRIRGPEWSGGAGDENRTRMTSLEGWGSTIELRPRGIGDFEFPLDSWSRRRQEYSLPSLGRTPVPGVRSLVRCTGCSAAWLARMLWEHEAAGSNPATPTKPSVASAFGRTPWPPVYLP